MRKIAIVMGSANDAPLVKGAADMLRKFGVPFDAFVYSAHRTPNEASYFAKSAREDGYGAIIACAGKSAHLAGVIAANTTLPVIGVPLKASALEGMDALLSTVQMPTGIPVATVAIDGAANAALLAIEILAVSDCELENRLTKYRDKLHDEAVAANENIAERL